MSQFKISKELETDKLNAQLNELIAGIVRNQSKRTLEKLDEIDRILSKTESKQAELSEIKCAASGNRTTTSKVA